MDRSLTYAANWKMNHGPAEARAFAKKFLQLTTPSDGRRLWFFPPAVSIAALCNTKAASSRGRSAGGRW